MITSKNSSHKGEDGHLHINYAREDEVVYITGKGQFNEAGLTAIIKELELIRDSMISIYTEEE